MSLGAINGDFFDGNGVSTGHQIVNGELVSSVQFRNWSKLAFNQNNRPFIERFNTVSEVYLGNEKRTINGVNSTRSENYIVLYNKFKGTSTGANQWGTEYLLKPLEPWAINDTINLEVKKIEEKIGNMEFGSGEVVLSAHGLGETFLSGLNVGDTLSIKVGMHPLGNEKITQLISGFPKIIKGGSNHALAGYSEEGGSATFATDRHPRTSAGFNADSTKLSLFVVDGRQSSSIGVSLIELADLMIMFGVHDGINLDGGGSSTMVVKHGVANSPSGGIQRAVSNALLIVSSEPTIIEEIRLAPDSVITNISRPIEFHFESYDKYGYKHNYTYDDVTSVLSNSSIGYFEDGFFYPSDEGETSLDLTMHNGFDRSFIKVENHTGTTSLNGFEELNEWIFSGEKIDTINSIISYNNSSYTEGSQSLQLDYRFTYESGEFHWAYLNANLPITGIPEKMEIDIMGDGQNHTIAFIISDENDERFAVLLNKSPSQNNFETLYAEFDNPIDIDQVGARFYFPIKLKQIAISLSSPRQNGETYSGQLLFDNLKIKYPENVSSADNFTNPSSFVLGQNYPNPFNPTTKINFSLAKKAPVEISIFNSLGEKLNKIVDGIYEAGKHEIIFNAHNYSSGVYFYRMISEQKRQVRRMIILK
jgi:hypothetical protein